MDWTVITGVAEAVAAFGVVGSLIFVGFQVRQNSTGLRHAAAQAHIAVFQDALSNVINSSDMAEIWWTGFEDPGKLKGPALLRFFLMGNKLLRTCQGMHWQWRQGVLDDGLFYSMNALLKDLAAAPGWQHIWSSRRHHFDPVFQNYMDEILAGHESSPLFPEYA